MAWSIHELVNNPHRVVSLSDVTGVLEVIWAADELQREINGWYLLTNCSIDAEHRDSLTDIVPFSVQAIHLGSRRILISRSAVLKEGASSGSSVVVQPFWGENDDGQPFVVNPGGTAFSREYDERNDYDLTDPIPGDEEAFAMWSDPEATWADPVATWSTGGRRLRIHAGQVS